MKKILILLLSVFTFTGLFAQTSFSKAYDSDTNQTTQTTSSVLLTSKCNFKISIGMESYSFKVISDVIIRGKDDNEYYCFTLENINTNEKVVVYDYINRKEFVVFTSSNQFIRLTD